MRSFIAFFVVAGLLGGAFVFGSVASGAAGNGDEELKGLWTRHPDAGKREDAPVAFYYFHSDGIGLFRFGKVGYNTTNSYNWSADDGTISLQYRKTGKQVRLPYRIEAGNPRVLVVGEDSQNPGVAVSRYTFVPADFAAGAADLFAPAPPAAISAAPAGSPSNTVAEITTTTTTSLSSDRDRIDNRLWMDLQRYATGGIGFSLYQLREAGIDGRGTGWHHVGDFDDWSTEALGYRINRRISVPQVAFVRGNFLQLELGNFHGDF